MKPTHLGKKISPLSFKALCLLISLFLSQITLAQNVVVSGALIGNGSYPDLNSAFTAINGGAQTSANISINVTGNTTETISAVLNAGAWTSLSITPSGGSSRVITGDISAPLIDLNGAGNIYVDGLNTSGNSLTISNTNTLNIVTTTVRFMNDATGNVFTKCTILGSSTSATLGTITYSTSTAVGNSSNTVSFSNIGPAGANLPVNGIYAAGTTGFANVNNTIQNCNIYDFFSATLSSSGILIAANNSNWNITGNRLYQTGLRTYTTANTNRGIQISSGNNYQISSNIIGYSSSTSTGVTGMVSTVAARYIAIDLAVGTLTATSVQGNTITAITLTTSSSASTANGVLCGINVTSGNVNIGTVLQNIIGGISGVDLITAFPTTTQGMIVGINSSSTGTISILNNYIGGFSSSGVTAAVAGGISGINISGATGLLSISNNTLGNATANNMRAGTVGFTTGSSLNTGINFAALPAGTVVVTGNVIRNFASYGTGTAGTMRGMYTTGTSGSTTYSIVNNTISNLTSDNGNVSVSNGQLGNGGIIITHGVANRIVDNTISNLSNTTILATAVCLAGISTAVSADPIISRNKIFNLSNTGTSTSATAPAMVFGVFIRGSGGDCNINNNMISLGNGQTSNTAFMGICAFGGGVAPVMTRIYFNSINILGTVTTGAQPSFGVYRGNFSTGAITFPMDVKNNIITNSRSGGTGGHYAIANNYGVTAASITGWAANSSNNNVLNASPSTVGWWTTSLTFAGWQTAAAGDANSYSGITVTYINPANDLHLNMGTTPTFIESGAQAISGITNDIDSQVRPGPAGSVNGGGLFPDIGADEIDGAPLDIAPPILSGSGFTNASCLLSGRTFTASFLDVAGVASGALAPRVYYKVNAGTYTSVSGTLTSGSVNNGVWTFNVSYSAALGDVISYYLVAQDAAGTPNLGSFPSAGFSGTSVNSITTDPTSPNTFAVSGTLNGIYTVGALGTYTSLTAAANAYNVSCLTGPVTFSLVDALYSTAETFPVVFTNNIDASATNSLLIRPAGGLAVALTPTSTTMNSVIKFLNARYITVDGVNTGGSSLTLNNSNISSASADIWLASSGSGNNFIGIKNLVLNGGYNNGSNGVIASVDGAAPSGTGGVDNDNITITGNSFSTFYHAVLAVASTSVSAGGMDNWVISNNLIGPSVSGTANIGANGVIMNGALNLTINSNTIQNLSQVAAGGGVTLLNSNSFTINANVIQNFSTSASGGFGINVNSNNNTFSISNNTIMSLYSSASSSGVNSIAGIYLGTGVITGTLNRNTIRTIENTSTSGYGARGVIVNTGNATSNINIRNNMISDIVCYSDASAIYWPMGIAIEGTSGGVNIDFNSINLYGSHAGLASANGSTPIYLNSTGGNIGIRNNMLSNMYDNSSSTTDITYGIYSNVASSNISVIDYNNYYVSGTASSLVLGYLGANQTNLAGIQTAFGGNVNSKNIAPVFTSNTDLHMQPVTGNVGLDNQGTPISGITVDIDNQLRSTTTPDMGADEFSVPTCTTANGGVLGAATATACAGQTLVATSTGVSTGLTTSYLWKVGVTPGGPYGAVSGGTGSTTTSYTSAPLGAGVYYVVLETVCAATSMTAVSNEGTLTVNAAPTASASSTTTLLCGGQNISLSGSSNIGTSYAWTGPNNYTSTTQNPSISGALAIASGNYSLFTAVNGCTSTAGVISVTVSAVPSAMTLSPASATICAGNSQSVSVLGASIPSVFNFTPQTNQNGTTTYPAPYSAYYGGQKMQFLVLASELTAQGLAAGALTSIQFPVVSLGSNWGSSINDNQSFQVSIKATPLTSVGTTFETGLTVVTAASNFTPTVGYNNTHVFGTPFNWDGTSNLIIETVFSNNVAGTTSDAVIQYNSATPFQSTMVYRADNQTFGAIAAATTTNVATSLIRPDFKLYQNIPVTFSWTPSTGLSSTTGNTVNATPASSTVYTVVASNGLNTACTNSASVSLSVAPLPTVSIVASSSAACVGGTVNLTAGGANTYLWDNNATTTIITVSPLLNTVYTVTGQTQFCGNITETISIVANPLPTVTAVSSATGICAGQTATLTGGGAVNYSWVSGPSSSVYSVSPIVTSNYTVIGTDALGCSDQATVSVAINTVVPISVSPVSATVCASSPATFTASGANTYSWSSGATSANATITPLTSGSYTVTGIDANGCSSSQTIALTANALPTVVITPASPTVCSNESILLTGSGAVSYSWMPGTSTSSTLTVNVSTTSSTYTIEGVDANNCKNTMSVTVTVDPCTGLREQNSLAGNVSLYPNPSTGLIIANFGFEGSKEISVLNSIGAVIMKSNTDELTTSFDLSGYAKGVYFIHVIASGTSANYKIIIQ